MKESSMVITRAVCMLIMTLLVSSKPLQAATISIVNPGFEDPVLADGAFVASYYTFGDVIGGWTTGGNVGSAVGFVNPTTATFSGEAPEGDNVAWLVSYNSAWLIQTLTTTYQEGETYTLTALVGDGDITDLRDFSIGLYDAGAIKSTGGSSPIPADDGFTLVTASVVADASMDGKPIEIRLGSFITTLTDDPDGTDFQVFFDDVKLTTTAVVPVPAALWLFCSGLLGLIGLSRRKRTV